MEKNKKEREGRWVVERKKRVRGGEEKKRSSLHTPVAPHLSSLASLVLLEASSMTPSLMLVLNCSQNFL